jgi:DNA processing protein
VAAIRHKKGQNVSEPLRYWVGFNLIKGIGPIRLRALVEHFGSVQTAWECSDAALRASRLLDERTLASVITTRKSCDLDAELRMLDRLGIQVITLDSTDYPPLLRQIPDPPTVLYIKGALLPTDSAALAVVGTRKATAYGKQIAETLVTALAASGVTIVSGLAHGIDTVAHQAALQAGGRTLAILPNGLDTVYPPENRALAEQILDRGALITEHPLRETAEKSHFAPRNRIISGISLGVLVVEAGEKSGALITADLALNQGRNVFAVPGNVVSAASQGTNSLIQSGAKMALTAADILDELRLDPTLVHAADALERQRREPAPLPVSLEAVSDDEARIVACLSDEPLHIDLVANAAGLPVAQVTAALWLLVARGLVREVNIQHYVLVDRQT